MKKFFIILLVFMLLVFGTVYVSAETSELPENNKLLSNEWVKGLGGATVKKEIVDGEEVYIMSKMDSTYASAYLDIYPSIKALMGNESEVSVCIVLDVRVVNADGISGEDFPFGMKLRPACTSLTKTQEAFNENYAPESDSFKHQYGSVSASMVSGLNATEDWLRVEIYKTFIDADINDEFWTKWNLCFDQLTDFESGASLQIKNAGIFLEDDYVPVEKEEEKEDENAVEYITPVTPSPATIYKPYDFDKYSVTFTVATESEGSGTNADNSDDGGSMNGNGDIMNVVYAAAAGTIAVAVIAVTVILIAKKNKRGGKNND